MTDRCYCQICKFVADVIPLGSVCRMADDIAIVAVVVTTICIYVSDHALVCYNTHMSFLL